MAKLGKHQVALLQRALRPVPLAIDPARMIRLAKLGLVTSGRRDCSGNPVHTITPAGLRALADAMEARRDD